VSLSLERAEHTPLDADAPSVVRSRGVRLGVEGAEDGEERVSGHAVLSAVTGTRLCEIVSLSITSLSPRSIDVWRWKMRILGALLGVGSLVAAGACGAETPAAMEAPSAADGTLATRDEGTSYNGWTHTPSGLFYSFMGMYSITGSYSRTSGDATRGGGVCFVVRKPGTTCSNDSTCTTSAVNEYGAGAYGYCYSGTCYSRPGAQGSFCNTNPNRSPGTIDHPWPGAVNGIVDTGNEFVLSCMTKDAGSNTACSCISGGNYFLNGASTPCGTDPSGLYMRTIAPVTFRTTYP
jgi:hypothetical protein